MKLWTLVTHLRIRYKILWVQLGGAKVLYKFWHWDNLLVCLWYDKDLLCLKQVWDGEQFLVVSNFLSCPLLL